MIKNIIVILVFATASNTAFSRISVGFRSCDELIGSLTKVYTNKDYMKNSTWGVCVNLLQRTMPADITNLCRQDQFGPVESLRQQALSLCPENLRIDDGK